MGYYVIHQTIPANTLRSNPIQVTLEVDNRILSHKEVEFPENAAMLCGIQLCDRSGRIWPSQGSPSAWITGDNNTVKSDQRIILSGSPYMVVAYLYNEDNTFDRTPEIQFEVVEK